MDGNSSLVICGVLDKLEKDNATIGIATLVMEALEDSFGGCWNVIIYPTYENEAGCCSSYLNWHSKHRVYAEKTTCIDIDRNEIKRFMDTEFGSTTIKDIIAVQQSAYAKINNKFPGTWRVHVAQLKNGYSWSIWGIAWDLDEFTFFIYRAG
ncbi:unnamed protein product [Rotaria sp. Silwood2]|nr:unnamed protein product [Rotaria sp. Silwood2]